MSTIASEVLAVAETAIPTSVAVQASEAILSTIAAPTPLTIMQDVELAIQLIAEFKTKMSGLHPSVSAIVKALF
jgi:hypothetical protein